ncbi:MAG TPA: DUF3617 family protein [Burkholderiales bacterium]|nr:DUF3617 family protein [Burkholderiales bacterium]
MVLLAGIFLSQICFGADLPKRKSGLWEMKLTGAGMPGHVSQTCVDQKSDDLMKQDVEEKMSCSKTDMRREPGKLIVDSVCKIEGSTATTRSVITGDFDSAYRVDSKTTYTPPLADLKEGSVVIDAKWLGPCKPGQEPGDIVIPGAGKLNLEELMKHAPKKP